MTMKSLEESLGNKAEDIMSKKSSALLKGLAPTYFELKKKIEELTVCVDNKSKTINTKLIEVNNKVLKFHVGRAISEYIICALVFLGLGLFGTLSICQSCYGKLQRMAFNKEIEIAENDGMQKYKNTLITSNSGLIRIKELELNYVKHHKEKFKNPDQYINNLETRISQMKKSGFYQD